MQKISGIIQLQQMFGSVAETHVRTESMDARFLDGQPKRSGIMIGGLIFKTLAKVSEKTDVRLVLGEESGVSFFIEVLPSQWPLAVEVTVL